MRLIIRTSLKNFPICPCSRRQCCRNAVSARFAQKTTPSQDLRTETRKQLVLQLQRPNQERNTKICRNTDSTAIDRQPEARAHHPKTLGRKKAMTAADRQMRIATKELDSNEQSTGITKNKTGKPGYLSESRHDQQEERPSIFRFCGRYRRRIPGEKISMLKCAHTVPCNTIRAS